MRLLPLVLCLAACGARVDPLAEHRAALARLAHAPVPATHEAHVTAAIHPSALGDLVRAAIETGDDPDGRFTVPTLLGPVQLEVHPEDDGAPVTLGPADCEGCVRVRGVLRGSLVATLASGMSVRSRGGVAADVTVRVDAETRGSDTDLTATVIYEGPTDIDVQLLGLPLGGMGLNDGLREGLRAALDGTPLHVATFRGDGPLPVHDVRVAPGGVVTASLRILEPSAAPAPPELASGAWVGLTDDTARGWLERWLLSVPARHWSARPADVTFADQQVVVTLEVYRHRSGPTKRRVYRVAGRLVAERDGWSFADVDVGRVDRRGVDLVSGAIRKRIARIVGDLAAGPWMTGRGDLPVRGRYVSWQAHEVLLDDGQLQVWFEIQ